MWRYLVNDCSHSKKRRNYSVLVKYLLFLVFTMYLFPLLYTSFVFWNIYSRSLDISTHQPLCNVTGRGGLVKFTISYWPTVKIPKKRKYKLTSIPIFAYSKDLISESRFSKVKYTLEILCKHWVKLANFAFGSHKMVFDEHYMSFNQFYGVTVGHSCQEMSVCVILPFYPWIPQKSMEYWRDSNRSPEPFVIFCC